MKPFGWSTRLQYSLLGALAGWLAGWAVCFPFELALAWRYVDGNARQLPEAFAKGLVVWAVFSFVLSMAGFLPLILPPLLLLSPAWIVRHRGAIIPAAALLAVGPLYQRMGFLHRYFFRHLHQFWQFFLSSSNIFALTSAVVAVSVYVVLAKRRLAS